MFYSIKHVWFIYLVFNGQGFAENTSYSQLFRNNLILNLDIQVFYNFTGNVYMYFTRK